MHLGKERAKGGERAKERQGGNNEATMSKLPGGFLQIS